jgi:hypothetical protein
MTKWILILCFQGGVWYTKQRIHSNHVTESEVYDAMWDEVRASAVSGQECRYIGTFNSEPAEEGDEDTG